MLRYVRVVLRDEKNRVLVLKNSDRQRWEFPGGKLEPGEREVDTAVRECLEEIGVRLTVKDHDLKYLTSRVLPIDGVEWLGTYFTAQINSGVPQISEPEKFSDMRWVTQKELAYLPQIPWGTYLVSHLETMEGYL